MTDPVTPAFRDNRGLDLDDSLAIAGDKQPTLPLVDQRPPSALTRLLSSRRSIRDFEAIDVDDVRALLSRLLKPESTAVALDGYRERRRPYPSAGARHPHTLLVLAREVHGLLPGPYVVVPDGLKALAQAHVADAEVIGEAIRKAARLESPAPVTLVTLARFRRTTAKYPGGWGRSLVWRDAGALLGYAHLIAADLGLASAIVGVGSTRRLRVGAEGEALVDTGAIVIGGPVGTMEDLR